MQTYQNFNDAGTLMLFYGLPWHQCCVSTSSQPRVNTGLDQGRKCSALAGPVSMAILGPVMHLL
jgi:hypothetical protein